MGIRDGNSIHQEIRGVFSHRQKLFTEVPCVFSSCSFSVRGYIWRAASWSERHGSFLIHFVLLIFSCLWFEDFMNVSCLYYVHPSLYVQVVLCRGPNLTLWSSVVIFVIHVIHGIQMASLLFHVFRDDYLGLRLRHRKQQSNHWTSAATDGLWLFSWGWGLVEFSFIRAGRLAGMFFVGLM